MESIRFPQGPDYEPTADVPLVTAEMRAMLKRLDRGNLLDVGMHIMDKAKDRYNRSETGELRELESMTQLIEDDETTETSIEIIHSMPKELIRAIVLKTTASQAGLDKSDTQHLRRDLYHRDGPGSYVVVIAVNNRRGRWLNGAELRNLISRIEMYLEAEESYRALPKAANGAVAKPTSQQTKVLAEFAARIDGHYAKARYPKPVYIDNNEQRAKVERLLEVLRQFLRCARDDVYMVQAPEYVGCSKTSTAERTENHMPRKGWTPEKRNHTYWLVLSCMRDMGLVPEVVTTRAVMTWAYGQLHLSEILVTMMAGSLVEQLGYNITQPGSTRDSMGQDWRQRVLAVTDYRRHLQDNLRNSLDDTTRRKADLDCIDSLDVSEMHLDVAERLRRFANLSRDAEEVKAIMADYEETNARIDANLERMKARVTDLREINLLAEQLRQALSAAADEGSSQQSGPGEEER
ncbi:hypothetical protein F4779DRAFT_615328 [Xylariaceae sp. FL0662B]|nr:hypothetical protein F4779DRAFT_615328 [Xylariaceae sp. FL0662B]